MMRDFKVYHSCFISGRTKTFTKFYEKNYHTVRTNDIVQSGLNGLMEQNIEYRPCLGEEPSLKYLPKITIILCEFCLWTWSHKTLSNNPSLLKIVK